METESSHNKIDAIYELREAVETKVHAEHDLAASGSDADRDALLEAQLNVEAKTQDAIDVCHECGQSHGDADQHALTAIHGRFDNVIAVDFRRQSEGA